jgi:hypothetical protein
MTMEIRYQRITLISGVIGCLLVGLVAFGVTALNWLDLGSSLSSHFPGSLLWATPKGSQSATFVNLAGRNAESLNRSDNGSYGGMHLTYVPADVASTGPTVISVNPINSFTWSAAALSDGTCYATLMSENPRHPQFGINLFTKYPSTQPCEARFATAATVKDPNVPN